MRAREFINEQLTLEKLPAGTIDPVQNMYIIPDIRNNDSYQAYRLGLAIARARADAGGVTDGWEPWTEQSAFGQNAVIMGIDNNVDKLIDTALKMQGLTGGKIGVGSKHSHEPDHTNIKSPVAGFKGYPR